MKDKIEEGDLSPTSTQEGTALVNQASEFSAIAEISPVTSSLVSSSDLSSDSLSHISSKKTSDDTLKSTV